MKLSATLSLAAATGWSGSAVCAPHLEPCKRLDGYQERVEQLMRDAAEEEMELLTIMYGFLPERGIALTRHDDGFDLIRLELDPSFWYSSWRDVAANSDEASTAVTVATEVHRTDGAALGAQVLDFSQTHVRVEKSSIPIGRELGLRLLDTFERGADDARVEEPTPFIMMDGYTYEILLSARPCVAVRNPPRDSQAGEIADLVRFLESRWQSRPVSERELFEAEVLQRIPR